MHYNGLFIKVYVSWMILTDTSDGHVLTVPICILGITALMECRNPMLFFFVAKVCLVYGEREDVCIC